MNARKLIRDDLIAALSHPTNGVVARYELIKGNYGLTDSLAISFAPESRSVVQSYIANENSVDMSQIADYPALVIYTTTARNTNIEKGRYFSGTVVAHVDIYLRYQHRYDGVGGMPFDDTEVVGDALEDAVVGTLSRYMGWSSGVVFNNEFQIDREPLSELPDGWQQRIAVELFFEVHL